MNVVKNNQGKIVAIPVMEGDELIEISDAVIAAMSGLTNNSLIINGDAAITAEKVDQRVEITGTTTIRTETELASGVTLAAGVVVEEKAKLTLAGATLKENNRANPIENNGEVVAVKDKNADTVYVKNEKTGSAVQENNLVIVAESEGTQTVKEGDLNGDLKGNWIVDGDVTAGEALVINKDVTLTVNKDAKLRGSKEITIKAGGKVVISDGADLYAPVKLNGAAGYYDTTNKTNVACVPATLEMNGTLRTNVVGDNDTENDPAGYTGNSDELVGMYNLVKIGSTAAYRTTNLTTENSGTSKVSAVVDVDKVTEAYNQTKFATAFALANAIKCSSVDIFLDDAATAAVTLGGDKIERIDCSGDFELSGKRTPAATTSGGYNDPNATAVTLAGGGLISVSGNMLLASNARISHDVAYHVGGTLTYAASVGDNPNEIIAKKLASQTWNGAEENEIESSLLANLVVGDIDVNGVVDFGAETSNIAQNIEFTGGSIDAVGGLKFSEGKSTVKISGNTIIENGTTMTFQSSSASSTIEIAEDKVLTISAGASIVGSSAHKVEIARAATPGSAKLVINGNLGYAASLLGTGDEVPSWVTFDTYGWASYNQANPGANSPTSDITYAWGNANLTKKAAVSDGYLVSGD